MQTLAVVEPKMEKKRYLNRKYRWLTVEQLRVIVKTYNVPDKDGVVQSVKRLAEMMDIPTHLVMEGVAFLRQNGAKLDVARKDDYYKKIIADLAKSEPEKFKQIAVVSKKK